MADLYNLDAELQQGLLGTEDDNAHLVNTAISTDEEQPNHHSTPHTTSMEQDDDDDDEMEASTSGYQSMSTVPVALREAAMERQKNRRGGDQRHDDNESDDGTNVQNQPNKGHWDTSKTDSYLFDTLQQQQQQEEKRNYEKQLQNLPYTHLYQAWTQERQAPELLPYPYETIQHIREGLIRYENYTFQDQQQQQQPGDVNHHGRRRGRHTNENLNALMESLLRIDAERVKFLLSDLLKRRIQKITLHPQYYTKLVAEETTVPREAEQEVNGHHEEQHHPLLCPAEVRLQFQRKGSNSVSVLFLTSCSSVIFFISYTKHTDDIVTKVHENDATAFIYHGDGSFPTRSVADLGYTERFRARTEHSESIRVHSMPGTRDHSESNSQRWPLAHDGGWPLHFARRTTTTSRTVLDCSIRTNPTFIIARQGRTNVKEDMPQSCFSDVIAIKCMKQFTLFFV